MRFQGRLLAILLTTGCAAAELPDTPQLKDYALPQMDFPLASGLRVLVQEDHSSPTVVVASVYMVGGAQDPKGVEGLAHFVEHLAFKSKFGGGKQMLWDILQRTGAAFNATTAADITQYYQIAHKDRLAELMQIEAWRLTHTLDGVTEEEFKTEREVVRNELRQRRETSVGNRTFDELLTRLFPASHPLGHPMAGTHESLLNAKLADAQKFVADHYKPSNCTIIIAGDVKAEEVKKLLGKWPAEALFGPGGPSGPRVPHNKPLAETPAPEPPPPVSTDLARLKGPVSGPELLIAWSAPGGLRGNDMILDAAGWALNSALQTGVTLKPDDDIRSLGAGAFPLADGSIIMIFANLKLGADPEKARRRIMDAVVDAWSTDESRDTVTFVKWYAATNLLMTSANPVMAALTVADHLATTGQTASYKSKLSELSKVKPNAVLDFVYKYVKRERAVSVFFEPEAGGAVATSGSGAGDAAKTTGHDLGKSDEVSIAGMGPDQIRRIARSPNIAALPRFKLANGMQVISVPRSNSPVAEIYMQIPGGDATASPYGMASLATRFSTTKCRDFGSLDPVGGNFSFSPADLATRLTVEVLAGNLVNGLAVLSDQVACREAHEETFLSLEEIVKPAIDSQKEREKLPQVLAVKKFWSTLYPNHPYGTVEVDWNTMKNVKHADADAYVRGHFRPGNATTVVVSDLPQAQLQPMVEKYFARWAGGGVRPSAPHAPTDTLSRAIFLYDRPGATQSTMNIGCRLNRVTPETIPAYDLVSAISSHMIWGLREQWGATYGMGSGVSQYPGGTAHFTISGAVETAKTGAAVDKLLAIVNTLGTQGPDIKAFTIKRWDTAREFERDYTTASSIAQSILYADRMGWPVDVWDKYPERLAETTRTQVRDAMAPCPGHEIITIVGDLKVMKAQLEKTHGKYLSVPTAPTAALPGAGGDQSSLARLMTRTITKTVAATTSQK